MENTKITLVGRCIGLRGRDRDENRRPFGFTDFRIFGSVNNYEVTVAVTSPEKYKIACDAFWDDAPVKIVGIVVDGDKKKILAESLEII